MAGNKISTKTKWKEDKGRANKGVTNINDDTDEPDFAMLRKPVPTSITGFAQARKIFDLATEELKDLLSNECDLLYECKVCRNIFRSLANLISHKRIYCKEKFTSNVHSHFVERESIINEMMQIQRIEDGYKELITQSNGKDNVDDEEEGRIPITKDLTTIVEKLTVRKGVQEHNLEDQQVVTQKIPNSSVAVFQNVKYKGKPFENIRTEVKEIDTILSRDKAILQSDGKFKIISSNIDQTETVIQISDDEDEGESPTSGVAPMCNICDLQFSTQKTLKFHMKYKHLESRLVYPCPDCLEIFSTSWSVYRHLFKVHRKTAAQIRRLRESIQSKAFKMNNPPAFYERRKNNAKIATAQKISEEERQEQENQAWLDNMEGDGEGPRCGGCGRTFERRAALAAHTHTCQPRSRALSRRPIETKRIEIQIRKDYHKGPCAAAKNEDVKTNEDGSQTTKEEEPPPPINDEVNKLSEKEKTPEANPEEQMEEAAMDVDNDNKTNSSTESPDKTAEYKAKLEYQPAVKLLVSRQVERNNFLTFKQKILPEIDISMLICKKCNTKIDTIQELYDHMAEHHNWLRYACKLCNFKNYNFSKVPEHVRFVHKLKGDVDFYFSTVKAIDGNEALELSDFTEEVNEGSEVNQDSRRPSRCSSDSSRLSDDSSSSSTRIDIVSRKRKMNPTKIVNKKPRNDVYEDRKETDDTGDGYISTKVFEENSSDMDDVDDKNLRKAISRNDSSLASRRPVRKKTIRKNADFEYDLSNLLKMEAQGYRDSQVTNTKPVQPKKKTEFEKKADVKIEFDGINVECCGALFTMSKYAAELNTAHIKMNFNVQNVKKGPVTPKTFAIPSVPKSASDKISPKKDTIDDVSSPIKDIKKMYGKKRIRKSNIKIERNVESTMTLEVNQDSVRAKLNSLLSQEAMKSDTKKQNIKVNGGTVADDNFTEDKIKTEDEEQSKIEIKPSNSSIENRNERTNSEVTNNLPDLSKDENRATLETITAKGRNIPAVVPITFRRQSLEVLTKNPMINKNLSDFTKAGMKTKILVIKPIHRNKDKSTSSINSPLKFQTIKLTDRNKVTACKDSVSDQVRVVKVPSVNLSERSLLKPQDTVGIHEQPTSTCEQPKCTSEQSTGTREQSTGTSVQSTGANEQSSGTNEQSSATNEQPNTQIVSREIEAPNISDLDPLSESTFCDNEIKSPTEMEPTADIPDSENKNDSIVDSEPITNVNDKSLLSENTAISLKNNSLSEASANLETNECSKR